MATYNLQATDLITLLNSTVTNETGRAILQQVESAFSAAFPFSTTSVNTTNGPSDVTDPVGFPIQNSDTLSGVQLELLTVPTSTSDPTSTYPLGASGTSLQTAITPISLTSGGGVVIGAGDQFVVVTDNNTGPTADTLVGGVYNEKLISGAGSNLLIAGSGLNSLLGGSGNDTLVGGGQSRLVAGSGANTLKSSTLSGGHDSLIGGAGRDLLVAQAGNNRLVAGIGLNTLQSGTGADTLIGGGNTVFQLSSGATRVVESVAGAKDTVFAGSGADTVKIFLNTSNVGDSIVGSTGSLRVFALSGSNTLQGGSGSDTLLLGGNFGVGGAKVSNTADQTITAGTGGVRIVTTESFTNFSSVQSGSAYTVSFSDTNQKLTINDATGSSVTLVFGDGHSPVQI